MATGRPRFVYKLLPANHWRAGRRDVPLTPQDRADGFLHLSALHQMAGTLARYFPDDAEVICLRFPVARLSALGGGEDLRWETSRGGDVFPHFYGNLLASFSDLQYLIPRQQADREAALRYLQKRELDEHV